MYLIVESLNLFFSILCRRGTPEFHVTSYFFFKSCPKETPPVARALLLIVVKRCVTWQKMMENMAENLSHTYNIVGGGGGGCPGRKMSQREMSRLGNVPEGNGPGGNVPGGKVPAVGDVLGDIGTLFHSIDHSFE